MFPFSARSTAATWSPSSARRTASNASTSSSTASPTSTPPPAPSPPPAAPRSPGTRSSSPPARRRAPSRCPGSTRAPGPRSFRLDGRPRRLRALDAVDPRGRGGRRRAHRRRLVECLAHHGVKTRFLVREPWYWPVALCREEGELVTEHMRRHGVDVRGEEVAAVERDAGGRVAAVTTRAGERSPARCSASRSGSSPTWPSAA